MNSAEPAREHPESWEPGEMARDGRTGRVGRVMGHVGPHYQLRPLNGGKEWEADAEHMRPATQSDAFSNAVAQANRHSVEMRR